MQKIQLVGVAFLLLMLVPTLLVIRTIQEIRGQAAAKKAVVSCQSTDTGFTDESTDTTNVQQLLSEAKAADIALDHRIKIYTHDEKKSKRKGQKSKQQKGDQLDEIRSLAEKRKELIIKLMYADPALALNLSKRDKRKEGYYLLADNCKVTPQKITGEISIMLVEYENKTFTEEYELLTDTGEEIDILATDTTKLELLEPDMRTTVEGFLLDKAVIIEKTPVSLRAQTLSGRGSNTDTPNLNITGRQDTIAIFANFQNSGIPNRIDSNKSKILNGIKNYYSGMSYGKVDFIIHDTPWLEVPEKASSEKCGIRTKRLFRAIREKADKSVNFKKYKHVVIFAPLKSSHCGIIGAAHLDPKKMTTDDGVVKTTVAMIDVSFNNLSIQDYIDTAVHEIGHGLGLMHAQAWRCSGERLLANEHECTTEEYGDPFSVMAWRGFLNARHLDMLNWFNNTNIRTVTEGTFTLEPLETKSNNLKALKIPRGNGDFLYVEVRKPLGVDVVLRSYADTTLFRGILLHTKGRQGKNRSTGLIDSHAERINHYNAAFSYGMPFIDPRTGTKVSIVSPQDTQTVTVEVLPADKVSSVTPQVTRLPTSRP